MRKLILAVAVIVGMLVAPLFVSHKTHQSAVPCLRSDGIIMTCESTSLGGTGGTYYPRLQYTDYVTTVPTPTPAPEPVAPQKAIVKTEGVDTAPEAPSEPMVTEKPFNPITDTNPNVQLGKQPNGTYVTN